ncbi:hypothetical protein L1887_08587 [Cichorium endivia]|nr:hypothetical protein L1887_08587 [Cichorium endivia]
MLLCFGYLVGKNGGARCTYFVLLLFDILKSKLPLCLPLEFTYYFHDHACRKIGLDDVVVLDCMYAKFSDLT